MAILHGFYAHVFIFNPETKAVTASLIGRLQPLKCGVESRSMGVDSVNIHHSGHWAANPYI